MRVEEISNLEALAGVLWIVAGAFVLYLLLPDGGSDRRLRERYEWSDVVGYDRALPKYGTVAIGALVVAAAHATLKSLPGIEAWLREGGHGGHLVRDIANTHLMIVMGGTVATTAITWYVLPRLLRRPLWSERLAGISFWCTVAGAGAFYLVNIVTGLWGAIAAHHGTGWVEANDAMGAWRIAPLGISATVMGIGYWTFVANVIATIVAARRVAEPGPDRHLAKFFAVGATGLLIGTVQGVIQVMPTQEAWLQGAGSAGEYIDPIAHAHVNLVTGTLMLAAGAALWWSRDPERAHQQRRVEQRLFWFLVPSSLAFYAAFMTLGFVEGDLMHRDGIGFLAAVDRLGAWHTVPLAVTGSLVLTGVWWLVAELVSRFRHHRTPAAGLVLSGMAFLVLGSAQGFFQLLPPVKAWLERAGTNGDAIANAHAQANMLGGVMLTLFGLVLLRPDALLGTRVPTDVAHGLRRWAVGGVAVYYAGAMASAIAAGRVQIDPRASDPGISSVLGPSLMAAGAAAYGGGFLLLGSHAWVSTATYREIGWRRFRHALQRYDGDAPRWVGHVPAPSFAGIELVGGLMGFPGFGWMLSGSGLVGLPIALVGPAIAWGVVPATTAPGSSDVSVLIAYLVTTALISTAALGVRLTRLGMRARRT